MSIEDNEVQSEKQLERIEEIDEGIVIVFNDLHFLKAPQPMYETDEGISIDVNEMHSSNA